MENNERPRKILKQWTDSRSDNQQVPYSTKKRLERKFRKIALNHEREENDVYMAVNRNEFNIHVQDEYQGYEEGPELIESNILNDLSAKDEEEGNNSEDHLSNTFCFFITDIFTSKNTYYFCWKCEHFLQPLLNYRSTIM